VLITLFNAPDRQLGMSALTRQAMLSPADTTHLVIGLERDGLVKRAVDPADRRKWFAVLTDQGDRTFPGRPAQSPQCCAGPSSPSPHPMTGRRSSSSGNGSPSPSLASASADASRYQDQDFFSNILDSLESRFEDVVAGKGGPS
jgi:hypothetical protein